MRSRNLFGAGITLVVIALLVFGSALLHVRLAPRVYSARARLSITSESGAPLRLQDLPLGSFENDRNLKIQIVRSSSLLDLIALSPTPDLAVAHANERARELQETVRSHGKARIELIEAAEPNAGAVRPNGKAILAVSGVAALNLGVVGVICVLVGFQKNRNLLASPGTSVQTTA